MKIKSGGGITSNKYVTSKVGQKVEPVSHKASPAGVAQQGMAVQFRKEPLQAGRGYEPKAMGPTGVPGKFNVATSGPGSGRTIHPTGSQSQYGAVNPGQVNRSPDPPSTVPGRDILSDYGPEVRRR
jgi:hypothetical protein